MTQHDDCDKEWGLSLSLSQFFLSLFPFGGGAGGKKGVFSCLLRKEKKDMRERERREELRKINRSAASE